MIYTPDQPLRVLTLWQPWASLVEWREKRFETRSGNFPNYRGWVAIHASKDTRQARLIDLNPQGSFAKALMKHTGQLEPWKLPAGNILCLAWFDAAFRTEDAVNLIGTREIVFGDYQPGRLAIAITDVSLLSEYVPHRGGQGLRIAPQDLRDTLAKLQRTHDRSP